MKIFSSLAVLGLAMSFGCSKGEDDVVEATLPNQEKVAFEGKVDPAMTSTWQTPDGRSTFVLRADGTADVKSNVATPAGMKSSDMAGKWKASDGVLLIQGDDGTTTRFFTTKKDANTIEMRRLKDSKIRNLYKRKA